jgi:serine/threonine protein kinase/WD40 repeat protein
MPEPISSARVSLLADEFLERYRRGERPSIREYAERYPELAEEIGIVFPAVAMMEHAAVADESLSGVPTAVGTPAVGEMGDFRIIREIGRGGMGVVYEAEQLSLGRIVALKLLSNRSGHDDLHRQRFLREARTAAKLHHTNIVPVFGFGTADGVAYYAMQYIRGHGLDAVIAQLRTRSNRGASESGDSTAICAEDIARSLVSGSFERPDANRGTASYQLPPGPVPSPGTGISNRCGTSTSISNATDRFTLWQGIARFGAQIANALDYAHRQGVLHRDVKPSNLLLDVYGNAWVTDFGLAKSEGLPDITRAGDLLGTVRYMPPEAFDGKADARSDVYSLGLTLYELLALRPAFDETDRAKLVRQVAESNPPSLRKRVPSFPRDLATIIEKAIEKEPRRRYQTAGALADDLQRFLDGRTIAARRVGELERVWMWARRRPGMAGLVAALVLCLVGGSAISVWLAVRANQFASDSEQTRNAAKRQTAELLLDRGIEHAQTGEPAWAMHLFALALRTVPGGDPESAPIERMIRTHMAAWADSTPNLEQILPGIEHGGGDTAFNSDGSLVAYHVAHGELRCFRTDTGAPVGPPIKLTPPQQRLLGPHYFLAFAADGKSLWVASGREDPAAPELWQINQIDPVTGQPLGQPILSTEPVSDFVTTPDGRFLIGFAYGRAENHPTYRDGKVNAVVVWNTGTGEVVRRVETPNCQDNRGVLGLSPDGTTVNACVVRKPPDGNCVSFPADGSGEPRWERRELRRATFYPNPVAGLTHDAKGLINRWSVAPGMPQSESGIPTLGPIPEGSVHSTDGRFLIAPLDGRLIDTGAWPPRPSGIRTPWGDNARGGYHRLSPDQRYVMTRLGAPAPGNWLWQFPRPHSRPPSPPGEVHLARPVQRGVGVFDRQRIRALIRRESMVRIVHLPTGAISEVSDPHRGHVWEVAFSPDERTFATASSDGSARVWDSATGRPAGPPLEHGNYVAAVAFNPGGSLGPAGSVLAAGDFGPKGKVFLWKWREGKKIREEPFVHDDIVIGLRFSPDGRYLAAVKTPDWSKNPEIWLWDVASGECVAKFPYTHLPDNRWAVEFMPDGQSLLTMDSRGILRVWEIPSGKLLKDRVFVGLWGMEVSPDRRTVAISASRGVHLLDANTLESLPGRWGRGNSQLPTESDVVALAFSPDAKLLITGTRDGTAQLWDIASRKPIGPPAVLIGPIAAVAFSTDGRTCLCVGSDGTVRRWPVPAPIAEPDLRRLIDRVVLMTGQRMNEDQVMTFVPADEWKALRERLIGTGTTALVPRRSDAEWHDRCAADAEQDGDTYGAEWHLVRLAALRPDDWTVAARRGRNLLLDGRREEAAAAYDKARRLAPSPDVVADWLRAAASDDEFRNRADEAAWNRKRAIEMAR